MGAQTEEELGHESGKMEVGAKTGVLTGGACRFVNRASDTCKYAEEQLERMEALQQQLLAQSEVHSNKHKEWAIERRCLAHVRT